MCVQNLLNLSWVGRRCCLVVDHCYQNADGVRLWAKYLAPVNSSNIINIPTAWADFFTMMLLSLTHFDWATPVLQSQIWGVVNDSWSAFLAVSTAILLLHNLCSNLWTTEVQTSSDRQQRKGCDHWGNGCYTENSTPTQPGTMKDASDIASSSTSALHLKKRKYGHLSVPVVEMKSDAVWEWRTETKDSKVTLALTETVLPIMLIHQKKKNVVHQGHSEFGSHFF